MIRYALACVVDHEFEAWFSNAAAFDGLCEKNLVECPDCGSTDIRKQIMAPAVRASGEKSGRSAEADAARVAADVRKHIASTHDYVGENFAEEARSMYYGETEHRSVWGEVTPEVAKELREEGVPALPLPKPFAPEPPRKRNKTN